MFVPLESSWLAVLQDEFTKEYMKTLTQFLNRRATTLMLSIPPMKQVVSKPFHNTPTDIKFGVVVLGQDPYHGPGEAHGLSFSVQKGIRVPPSLRNIYKELHSDLENRHTDSWEPA